jgi:hypothetical protein
MVHQHIPHDPLDRSTIDRSEKPVAPYEKRMIALHNVLISKALFPGLSPIRRAAEEVDGQFTTGQLPENIPQDLSDRLPTYGERRVLAMESILCEVGWIQKHELEQEGLGAMPSTPASDQQTAKGISLEVAEQTDPPRYQVGDQVRVQSAAKPGHIRTPLYLLGKQGTVRQIQGIFKNPEELAYLLQPVHQLYLYLVEFEMPEIWGELCPADVQRDTLSAEFYEPWLIPVE